MHNMKKRFAPMWSVPSRVLDAQWHEEDLDAHHARLRALRDTSSALYAVPSNIDPIRRLPRAEARAARTHQAEIVRDNRKLMDHILSLQQDQVPTLVSIPAAHPNRPCSVPHTHTHPRFINHEGFDVGVPPAASHALYTTKATQMNGKLSKASMTWSRRRRERHAIDDENRKLVHRLFATRSCVNSHAACGQQDRACRKRKRFSFWHSGKSSKTSSRMLALGGRPPRWRPPSTTVACTCAGDDEIGDDEMIEKLAALGLTDNTDADDDDHDATSKDQNRAVQAMRQSAPS